MSFVLDILPDGRVDGEVKLWPYPECEVNRGFQERVKVRLLCPSSGFQLYVDDALLQCLPIEGGEQAWVWDPGFFAGMVTAELLDHTGNLLATYRLDVSTDKNKLGHETFRSMIEDIRRSDPVLLLGDEPAQIQFGALNDAEDPWGAFFRLRAYGYSFLAALKLISQNPIKGLKRERYLVPIDQVKHVDRQTALTGTHNVATSVVMSGDPDLVGPTYQASNELRFDVPVVTTHLDSAATRCITAAAIAVRHRATELLERLERIVDIASPSETRTSLMDRWPKRADYLKSISHDISFELRKKEPWRSITKPERTASGLTAISSHPTYARAYRLAWKALRAGFDGDLLEDWSWISPTWEVYERWCYVKIANALQAKLPNFQWSKSDALIASSMAGLVGKNPDDGTVINLLLQPRFRYASPPPQSGFWSISGERIPDIVLTVRQGEKTRFLILDAKYSRVRSAVLDAMTSAHIYHDALRWHTLRPSLCLLLIPTASEAGWLEAPEFWALHGVGAVVMEPQTDCSIDVLLHFLSNTDA